MQPKYKSPELEQAIESMFNVDRVNSIREQKCVNPPIGCGKPALEFRNQISFDEYCNSGLCQTCQDKIFMGV